MIRNKELFFKNLPAGYDTYFDWDYLLPIFGDTKISPMDIDAIVERNNQFLVFETKSDFASIPLGQRRTLRALHKLNVFTIIAMWMKDGEVTLVQLLLPNQTEWKTIEFFEKHEGAKYVYDFVSNWWAKVNIKTETND